MNRFCYCGCVYLITSISLTAAIFSPASHFLKMCHCMHFNLTWAILKYLWNTVCRQTEKSTISLLSEVWVEASTSKVTQHWCPGPLHVPSIDICSSIRMLWVWLLLHMAFFKYLARNTTTLTPVILTFPFGFGFTKIHLLVSFRAAVRCNFDFCTQPG